VRFSRIDFAREGRWLLLIVVGLPAVALLFAVVIPLLMRP